MVATSRPPGSQIRIAVRGSQPYHKLTIAESALSVIKSGAAARHRWRARRPGSALGGRPPGTVAPTADSSHRQIKHAQPGAHSRRCLGRLPSDPVSSSRPPRPRAALRAVSSRRPLTRQPPARILASAGKDGPEWQAKAVTERVRPAIAADVDAMTAMAADRRTRYAQYQPVFWRPASNARHQARRRQRVRCRPPPGLQPPPRRSRHLVGVSAASPSPPGPATSTTPRSLSARAAIRRCARWATAGSKSSGTACT